MAAGFENEGQMKCTGDQPPTVWPQRPPQTSLLDLTEFSLHPKHEASLGLLPLCSLHHACLQMPSYP